MEIHRDQIICPYCEEKFNAENIIINRVHGGNYVIFACPECHRFLTASAK